MASNGLAEVYEAHPVTLANSEPEPDLAVVRPTDSRYLTRHPAVEDIYWLVEISDTTLADDLERKRKIYARAGIEEYWVINLKASQLIVFEQPEANDYQIRTEYSQGNISPRAFPLLQVSVAKVIGKD